MGRLRIDRLCGPAEPLRTDDGRSLAERCHRAGSPLARLVGLLGTADMAAGEALWLEPCSTVHTVGLRARIGCAFLDPDGRVMRVVDPLAPRRAAGCRGARTVVECPAGVLTAAGVRAGDVLRRG